MFTAQDGFSVVKRLFEARVGYVAVTGGRRFRFWLLSFSGQALVWSALPAMPCIFQFIWDVYQPCFHDFCSPQTFPYNSCQVVESKPRSCQECRWYRAGLSCSETIAEHIVRGVLFFSHVRWGLLDFKDSQVKPKMLARILYIYSMFYIVCSNVAPGFARSKWIPILEFIVLGHKMENWSAQAHCWQDCLKTFFQTETLDAENLWRCSWRASQGSSSC